ncbi:MAG: phosphotransferase [Bacteroidales bacterium]
MKNNHISALQELFYNALSMQWDSIDRLPASGSDRIYFRIRYKQNKSLLGVYNPHIAENRCFIEYAQHFSEKNLNTPCIIAVDASSLYYLVEDISSVDLFSSLTYANKNKDWNIQTLSLIKDSLRALVNIQIEGDKGLNYKVAYPVPEFDIRSVKWDFNYFKYYLLKPKGISFDELQLEKDFETFAQWLTTNHIEAFMFRDFQSRNVLIKESKPYFIDFQGGRKGPVAYDLVSFLWQVSANIPASIKEELIDFYLVELGRKVDIDTHDFKSKLPGFVIFRLMQVMGAYGYRGLYERKPHFLKSLQPSFCALNDFLQNHKLPILLPELERILMLLALEGKVVKNDSNRLNIQVCSFSYLKSGIPKDSSPNGGGHVFDCRFLPNPGRIDQYKSQNGTDSEVIQYLENQKEVHKFIDSAFKIIDASVENYLERNFTNLMISFGCTGGQHRSVYSAERTFEHLKEKYDVDISIEHVMKDHWISNH